MSLGTLWLLEALWETELMAYVCFLTLCLRYVMIHLVRCQQTSLDWSLIYIYMWKGMYKNYLHIQIEEARHTWVTGTRKWNAYEETMWACCINTHLLLALYIRINGYKRCLSLLVPFRAQRVCVSLCAFCGWKLSLTLLRFSLCEWERGYWLPLLSSITMPARGGGGTRAVGKYSKQSALMIEGLFSCAANPVLILPLPFLFLAVATILLIPFHPLFYSSCSSPLPSNVSVCVLCKDTCTLLCPPASLHLYLSVNWGSDQSS